MLCKRKPMMRERKRYGVLVVRFWNTDVLMNLDGVLETLISTLQSLAVVPPHPTPLPGGERELR